MIRLTARFVRTYDHFCQQIRQGADLKKLHEERESMTQKIYENTSSDELLAALDSNMIAFWSAYGRAKGNTLQVTPNVVWFYTGIPDELFNGVFSANMDRVGVKTTLDNLQAKIEELGAPVTWYVGPQSKPENLGALLEQHGLQPTGEMPGMAIDLELVDDKPGMITNFTIQKASNAEMQALWARIAAVGNGFSDTAIDAWVRVEATMTEPEYKAQPRYIGFMNDTPVATSVLVLDSGVAGIYAVATIPEARRRGIGKIMTVTPLLEARQIGYRVGILQASSMGYSIYKKMGFREVCKYGEYLQS
jgi:ribosomal protein S18 acetylase RimI-like enzyme